MEQANILKDVVAYVEVRSNSDNRSAAVGRELELLGAKVATSFTDDVTHVVFKEGLKRTHSKAQKKGIPLVSVSWLESCKRNQLKMPEKDYAALVVEEPDDPMWKLKKHNRRWKKMKSMQPCDFEEEVAKSAERSTKRRRRIEMANRFKLCEDSTPPGGSPALILALDTQTRSPFYASNSRCSSPSIVPDTPSTPTMQERIERMRMERKNVLGDLAESPKSSLLESSVMQKRMFEKLAKDLFSTEDSSDEEDGGETTARVVAKLIEGLDSKNNSFSPVRKRSLSEKSGENSGVHKCCEERVGQHASANTPKSSYKCAMGVDQSNGNIDGVSAEVSNLCRSTPRSKRKSIDSFRENHKRRQASFVAENRLSGETLSDDSVVLSPVSASNTLPSAVFLTSVTANTEANTSKSPCSNELETPKTAKVVNEIKCAQVNSKIIKKRKLFSDPIFGSVFLPVQEDGETSNSKQSPEAPSSNPAMLRFKEKPLTSKGKRQKTCESADVSFMFPGANDKTTEKTTVSRRKSKRLSICPQIDNFAPIESGCNNASSSEASKFSFNSTSGKNDTKIDSTTDTTSLKLPRSRQSLGTSMSVLYGADSTLIDSTIASCSRRSIDEFSTNAISVKGRMKKKKCQSGEQNLLKLKQSDDIGADNPPKKRKVIKSLHVDREVPCDTDSRDSGSDTSVEKLPNTGKLRHASSLIMEDASCQSGNKGPLSLVMTSLHRSEQDIVLSVVKKLQVFHVTSHVNASTTHVICGEPRRTLNLLRGIARGCWVLKKEWVLQSLEAGAWLKEETFEMEDDFPAAKETRLKRQNLGNKFQADLLSHMGPYFVSNDCVPPREDLVNLITLCSGKVTNSRQRAAIYFGMTYLPNKIVIKPAWILDSIIKMSAQDLSDYVHQAPHHHRESSPEF